MCRSARVRSRQKHVHEVHTSQDRDLDESSSEKFVLTVDETQRNRVSQNNSGDEHKQNAC